ncbi:MAG: hypothetical protein PW792_13450 [Acidobacteriaceae bacterium]|nr:hypothetical protein [Acidobacteriaceae bacterium]
MHFLTAFFAFFFSFGHAQSLARTQVHDAFIPPTEYAAGLQYAVPSRHDLLNGTYAGTACPGCQMTTVSYTVRSN